MDLKQMHDEMLSAVSEMRRYLDQQDSEIKQTGAASAETKSAIKELNTRIDKLEVVLKRPGLAGGSALSGASAGAHSEAKAAFVQALRKGRNGLTAEEKSLVKIASPGEAKALDLGDDTAGGFLAPSEYVDDIIKQIILFSPVRTVANVRTTSNRSVQIPVRKGVYAAKWVSETGTRQETKGLSYGMEELANFELYAEVLISDQDLEDSAFDLNAELMNEASEQFGVAEGAAFIAGSGVGQPEGLLTKSDVASIHSGSAAAITGDGLINLAYSGVKSAYAQNASWLMRRESVGSVRLLKDQYGQYLWQPGLALGQPDTLLGRPIVECPDMPLIAANATPVIFGDVKRAYTIVDRVQMVVKRLDEKYAESGQTAFIYRKRVGGQVVLSEAIAKLIIAA